MTETEIYKLKYLIIPDFIYEDKRLSGLQVKIASFIYTYKGDSFYFSNQRLGDMFNVSVASISNAVNRLGKLGYIKLSYKMKSNGGKIRFISRLQGCFTSDFKDTLRLTSRVLEGKGNKIKGNKIKGITYKGISYLEKLSDKDLTEFSEKFSLSKEQVQEEADKASDYCKSKGRKYANYKAFLRNWLRSPYRKVNNKKRFEAEDKSKYNKYGKGYTDL